MASRAGLRLSEVAPQAVLRPLKQPLYDTNIYAAAGQANLQFFAIPLGAAMPVTAVAKTLADTNMQQASQLGTPNVFELFGFKFKYQQSVLVADDFDNIYDTGVFTFNFGQSRPFLQVPLSRIPAGCMPTNAIASVDGVAAPGNTLFNLQNGPSSPNSYFNFTVERKPMLIGSNEVFSASVGYPLGGVAVNANCRVQVFLVGIFHRAI